MKTIFISLPIHGKTNEEITKAVNDAEKWWAERNHTCEPATFVDNLYYTPSVPLEPGSKEHRIYCLGVAIQKLGQCDGVIFCPGWRDANGCRVEHSVAFQYGIPIYDMEVN